MKHVKCNSARALSNFKGPGIQHPKRPAKGPAGGLVRSPNRVVPVKCVENHTVRWGRTETRTGPKNLSPVQDRTKNSRSWHRTEDRTENFGPDWDRTEDRKRPVLISVRGGVDPSVDEHALCEAVFFFVRHFAA